MLNTTLTEKQDRESRLSMKLRRLEPRVRTELNPWTIHYTPTEAERKETTLNEEVSFHRRGDRTTRIIRGLALSKECLDVFKRRSDPTPMAIRRFHQYSKVLGR